MPHAPNVGGLKQGARRGDNPPASPALDRVRAALDRHARDVMATVRSCLGDAGDVMISRQEIAAEPDLALSLDPACDCGAKALEMGLTWDNPREVFRRKHGHYSTCPYHIAKENEARQRRRK